ncbi:MAG: ATPase, T2SS/T4P/T4SS family, partial [Lachnospiraceae bacterium]
MMREEKLQEQILCRLDLSREVEDDELIELIHQVLEEYTGKEYIPLQEKAVLGRELFNAFRKLDILQELVEDDTITEIMINGTEYIFIEQEGRIRKLDKRFATIGKLEDVIQQIVSDSNRLVNESSPIVDARLKDGSRVNVVLSPVALNGPIVTIRKFPKNPITMGQLLEWEAVGEEVQALLKLLVKAKYNIFISGGTGSGKTTFLNALSHDIPKDERIITIEDNAELQ